MDTESSAVPDFFFSNSLCLPSYCYLFPRHDASYEAVLFIVFLSHSCTFQNAFKFSRFISGLFPLFFLKSKKSKKALQIWL